MNTRTTTADGPAGGRALASVCLLSALVISVLLLAAAEPARAATTFTVNSIFDQGDANFADGRCDTEPVTSGNQCTLRAAVEQANEAPGADAIHFSIGGSGVRTIRPNSPLPDITEAVTIDGYTQPGAKKNTLTKGTNAVPLIQLNGQNALVEDDVSGLLVDAPDVVVRGLVINGYDNGGSGITVIGADARIEGNFLGTDPSGTDIVLNSAAGVDVRGTNVTVGGAAPAARNLISGNSFSGIFSTGTGTKVQGNLIGTSKDGTSPLRNGGHGVLLGFDNIAAIDNTIVGNTIAFNVQDGVAVSSSKVNTGNRVLSNSIFSNGQEGIDLGLEGPTANDGDDPNTPEPDADDDVGPNNLQNKPVIKSATTAPGKITIEGNLNSTPNKTFTARFFSNLPGEDEGRFFIGQRAVTTNAKGNAPFAFTLARTVQAGRTVTATATGADGTSEFAVPRTVTAAQ